MGTSNLGSRGLTLIFGHIGRCRGCLISKVRDDYKKLEGLWCYVKMEGFLEGNLERELHLYVLG